MDPEEIEATTYPLAEALRQVDGVLSVETRAGGSLPPGAMGTPGEVGALLVQVLESLSLTGLVGVLAAWLGRDRSRTLKIQLGDQQIELTGLSRQEQHELVDWFRTQAGMRFER
jgi:hypothetical protein